MDPSCKMRITLLLQHLSVQMLINSYDNCRIMAAADVSVLEYRTSQCSQGMSHKTWRAPVCEPISGLYCDVTPIQALH